MKSKGLKVRRRWSKDTGCRPFLAGALRVNIVVDGWVGKLIFGHRCRMLVRRQDTRTTGKM